MAFCTLAQASAVSIINPSFETDVVINDGNPNTVSAGDDTNNNLPSG